MRKRTIVGVPPGVSIVTRNRLEPSLEHSDVIFANSEHCEFLPNSIENLWIFLVFQTADTSGIYGTIGVDRVGRDVIFCAIAEPFEPRLFPPRFVVRHSACFPDIGYSL